MTDSKLLRRAADLVWLSCPSIGPSCIMQCLSSLQVIPFMKPYTTIDPYLSPSKEHGTSTRAHTSIQCTEGPEDGPATTAHGRQHMDHYRKLNVQPSPRVGLIGITEPLRGVSEQSACLLSLTRPLRRHLLFCSCHAPDWLSLILQKR